MIEMTTGKGLSIVRLACDVCHEPITDVGMAMVRWRRETEDYTTDLVYCHKGKCDKTLNRQHEDDPWWELRHFLARLVFNCGMRCEDIIRAMDDVEELQKLG